MKIHTEATTDICVNEMKDGDVAVITKWESYYKNVGTIVQRYQSIIIALGQDSGSCWTSVLNTVHPDCRVRILPKGTLIEV